MAPIIYVLEVGETPVLAFPARGIHQANGMRREAWLQDELRALHHGGRPLWDGAEKLGIRRASDEEAATYVAAYGQAVARGEQADDDEDFIAYLLEVTNNDPD